ncbi:MAG: sodium:proton antiporter [Candidatus Aminicenantes bacterium]|nr:sodium:proton antiporter [Candidatus Aminicenantes bacterium]
MPEENLGLSLPLWTIVPFIGLLLSIAFLPLRAAKFWEHHRNKALVCIAWSIPVAAYFLFRAPHELLLSLKDYASFLLLLTALYVVSGGIVLRGDIRATPEVNATFLFIGAVLANLIGTTGASMVLIRPLLQTNREREHVRHIPVFFIFLVSNIGGLLTPLGDPPLFMGFLRGVPFFWTLRLFPQWVFMVAAVLAIFYIVDRRAFAREEWAAVARDRAEIKPLRLRGVVNFLWIAGVASGVFLPFPFREALLAAMCVMSLVTTRREYRHLNEFTYNPIIEVAVLFAGIFVTMVPALLILGARGAELGLTRPWQFFWVTGFLSSFLDNTPTYLTFFSLAQGLGLGGAMLGIPVKILLGISAGAVFMGANSYIGNGPNFMVKCIAEEYRLRMPSFFGYMAYSALVLVPLYIVATFIFFR